MISSARGRVDVNINHIVVVTSLLLATLSDIVHKQFDNRNASPMALWLKLSSVRWNIVTLEVT